MRPKVIRRTLGCFLWASAGYKASSVAAVSMARTRTRYRCQECGHSSPGWLGKCPSCGFWDSFVEETGDRHPAAARKRAVPVPIDEVETDESPRIVTGCGELDRLMGGGIMRGSVTLVAGDPGIGKSTLMTELGRYVDPLTVLYVTGEESARQVKLRARRLGVQSSNLLLLAETNARSIQDAIEETVPDVFVVDSIQTLYREEVQSAPGSVSQVRGVRRCATAIDQKDEFCSIPGGACDSHGIDCRPPGSGAHGGYGALLRGRSQPWISNTAGGEEPVRIHQRDRRVRNDGRRPARGLQSQRDIPVRTPGRLERILRRLRR